LFENAVRKYRALQFHLKWFDDDGGLQRDPLFGGDLTTFHRCFGELYTSQIGRNTWFKDGQGTFSFVCVNSLDTIEIPAAWFAERGLDVRKLTESEALRLVREAHPEHGFFVERFATEDECLYGHVVNRVAKLNDLILETWGAQWFSQRDKVPGSVRFEDLSSEEYDCLIAERYPECILCHQPLSSRWREGLDLCKCPPMTDQEEQAELERREAESKALRDNQSDDSTDFFANLAKANPAENDAGKETAETALRHPTMAEDHAAADDLLDERSQASLQALMTAGDPTEPGDRCRDCGGSITEALRAGYGKYEGYVEVPGVCARCTEHEAQAAEGKGKL
jgi:hypothetical protein